MEKESGLLLAGLLPAWVYGRVGGHATHRPGEIIHLLSSAGNECHHISARQQVCNVMSSSVQNM